jgi:hypothetical protein
VAVLQRTNDELEQVIGQMLGQMGATELQAEIKDWLGRLSYSWHGQILECMCADTTTLLISAKGYTTRNSEGQAVTRKNYAEKIRVDRDEVFKLQGTKKNHTFSLQPQAVAAQVRPVLFGW